MNRREAIAALVAMPAVTRILDGDLGPRDVIVAECDAILSMENTERIRQHLEQIWPGRKVLVLGRDIRVKVVPNA